MVKRAQRNVAKRSSSIEERGLPHSAEKRGSPFSLDFFGFSCCPVVMWLSLDGLFSFVTSSMSISPTSYPSGINRNGTLEWCWNTERSLLWVPFPPLSELRIDTLSWGTVAERDPWGSVVNHLVESEQVDRSLFPTPPCPSPNWVGVQCTLVDLQCHDHPRIKQASRRGPLRDLAY